MVHDVTVKRAESLALRGSLYQRSAITIWQRTNRFIRWRPTSRSSTPHHFPGLITQCTLWTNLVGIHTSTSCVPKTRRKVAGSWRSFWVMSGASVGALDESGLTLGVNTSITPPPKASWNSSRCFLNLKNMYPRGHYLHASTKGWIEAQRNCRTISPHGWWNGECIFVSWQDVPYFLGICISSFELVVQPTSSLRVGQAFPIWDCFCQTAPFWQASHAVLRHVWMASVQQDAGR